MRYDTVLKRLLAEDLTGWANFLRLPDASELTLIDTGIQTIQATVDKLIQVGGSSPYLIHIEFQSWYHPKIDLRMLRYSALIEHDFGIPVQSVLLLLSTDADGPACRGYLKRQLPSREICYHEFRFDVIRVWEIPVHACLHGGLGTLALAPICDLKSTPLPAVITEMKHRVDAEILDSAERNEFWTAVEILMGAVFDLKSIEGLLKGIADMAESVTALRYIEQGRQQGRLQELEASRQKLREIALSLGEQLYGVHSDAAYQRIQAFSDIDLLAELPRRIVKCTSWDALLDSLPSDTSSSEKQ